MRQHTHFLNDIMLLECRCRNHHSGTISIHMSACRYSFQCCAPRIKARVLVCTSLFLLLSPVGLAHMSLNLLIVSLDSFDYWCLIQKNYKIIQKIVPLIVLIAHNATQQYTRYAVGMQFDLLEELLFLPFCSCFVYVCTCECVFCLFVCHSDFACVFMPLKSCYQTQQSHCSPPIHPP